MIADDMLGPKGRKVRCATCSHVWRGMPLPQTPAQEIVQETDIIDQAAPTAFDMEALADEPGSVSQAAALDVDDDAPQAEASIKAAARAGVSSFSRVLTEKVRRSRPDSTPIEDEDIAPMDESAAIPSGPVDGRTRKKGPRRVRLKGLREGPPLVVVWARKALGIVAPVAVPVVVLAGLVLLVLAVPYRDAVVRAVPDLAKLYALVGLEVNVRGVVFSQFQAERATTAGLPVLRIDGVMMNVEGEPIALGPLRLALVDDAAQELFVWRVEPDQDVLAPGSILPIASELTAPPANVASVAVRFMQVGEQLPGQDF